MFFKRIYIGTSGWSYDDWIGPCYESDKWMFRFYSSVFNTSEINSTFYKMPTRSFIRGLAHVAPVGFVFSAKLVKTITHKKLLNPKLGVNEDLKEYLSAIEPLRKERKLGAILIQMPPRSTKEVPFLEDFLALLPTNEYRFAIEFRDHSWLCDDVFNTLEKYNVAYVVVDEPLLPPITKVTARFSYIRWHGRGERPWYYYQYKLEELREWVPKVKEILENTDLLYGYFNNHFRGYAPRNALQMLSLLGLATRRQRHVLKRIEEFMGRKEVEKTKLALADALASGRVDDILLVFAGERRYNRGVEIEDNLVKIEEVNDVIKAKIKDYKIIIDTTEKVIQHNCADWEKRIEGKKFCKHLVKLFTMLPKEVSVRVLSDIASNLDEWSFEII